jgi:hypothetical protein
MIVRLEMRLLLRQRQMVSGLHQVITRLCIGRIQLRRVLILMVRHRLQFVARHLVMQKQH